jgi:Tol biopolymer transport system component
LAYSRGDIFLYDWTTRTTTQLTTWGDCISPSWSPDGQWLAYVYNVCNYGAACGIWLVRRDGTDGRLAIPNGWMPAWSHDGTRIAFVALDQSSHHSEDIFIFRLSDGSISSLVADSLSTDRSPAWSPDDAHVVWAKVVRRTDARNGLWIVNTDATNPHQLTMDPEGTAYRGSFEPAWSPDGGDIAYRGHDVESNTQSLWIVRSDGSSKHRLTHSGP